MASIVAEAYRRAALHDPLKTAAATVDPSQLGHRIVELAADKKASDIVMLRVSEVTSVADYFVICSGRSERQVGAIADGIQSGLRDEGIRPIGVEGEGSARWVLIDYGAVIAHVFAPDEREYYGLERVWSAAQPVVRMA